MSTLIKLDKVHDNPYQPRTTDDPAHIESLARSIATEGLLQEPKARANGKGYQLAFGHSRRKAFEWLVANFQAQGLPDRYEGYTAMPLEILELTDEQMYRHAVTENVQRKDLNPIELAQAMVNYRDQFNKSSDQVGELFGVNGATVRGLVRLLDLPAEIQAKVASGEITQGAARKLLTIARVDEKQVKKAAERIAGGTPADDALEISMRDSEQALTMWSSWDDGKPRGGSGLWPLEATPEKFPRQHFAPLTPSDVAKALGIEFTAESRKDIGYWMGAFEEQQDGSHWYNRHGAQRIEGDIVEFLIAHGEPAQHVEKLAHLLKPPSCVGCPFHAVADRSHYCGFKACHARKRKAWIAGETAKISKKLGIPIYDPAADGKDVLILHEHTYNDSYKQHAKLVADKDPGLRLQPHRSEYSDHKWTESRHCRLILVGERASKIKEKKRDENKSRSAEQQNRERQYQLERARMGASDKFTFEYAVPFFAVAFKNMDHIPAMCALVGVGTPKKSAKKADVLADLRRRLAREVVRRSDFLDWRLREKGPTAVAKKLQGLATSWGVKLPADFLKVAKSYEPDVSAETKKS